MVYSTAGSTVIVSSTSFFLGCLLMNFVVDHRTLWQAPTAQAYLNAENHYKMLFDLPHIVTGTLAFVFGIGIMAHIVKLHKGNQSNTLFDGGSLVLFLISFALVFSNLWKGILVVVDGTFGEVGREDTLRVIAASNVIIAAVLFGVLVLQIGQGHAERAAVAEIRELQAAEVAEVVEKKVK